jgi:hypothetical protein
MVMNMGLLGGLFGGGAAGGSSRAVGAPINTQKSQGGLAAPPRFENAYPNRKTLIATDLIESPAPSTVSTKFTEVGSFTVPAQTAVRFGFGSAGGGLELNQGTLFADLENMAGTDLGGTSVLRFFASNSQGTFKSFFVENTLTRFNQTTPSERLRQPEVDPPIYEDSRVVFELKPNASGNVANTESTLEIDVTQYL